MLNKQRLRTFLLGGAAGVLAGILLAPRSGRELRGSLANRAGEARERGRETYFDAQEQMRERLAEVREPRLPPDAATPETKDFEETVAGTPRSHLRDVSQGIETEESVVRDAERSEELRRKVRETRERLRGRKDRDLGPER
ncbi:MAG: YtxH domain-containing protein [Rubrobacter sp.]